MVKTKPSRLLVEERRRRIMDLLEAQERVTVDELVLRFAVSAVTIRGDLDALANAGAVVRSHGGALKRVDAPEDMPITVKETLHHAEKVRIGHAACQMIKDGETIMLDSGTTTAEIARQIKFLKFQALNVITNALNIAMELANHPNVRLIMIGGILRQMSYSLSGPHAEQTLRGLHADRLFLGVDGLDPEIGLMTPDVLEAQLNAIMIQVSREVVVVADSTKFHRRSLSVIAKLDSVHKLITDQGAPPSGGEPPRPQHRGGAGLARLFPPSGRWEKTERESRHFGVDERLSSCVPFSSSAVLLSAVLVSVRSAQERLEHGVILDGRLEGSDHHVEAPRAGLLEQARQGLRVEPEGGLQGGHEPREVALHEDGRPLPRAHHQVRGREPRHPAVRVVEGQHLDDAGQGQRPGLGGAQLAAAVHGQPLLEQAQPALHELGGRRRRPALAGALGPPPARSGAHELLVPGRAGSER